MMNEAIDCADSTPSCVLSDINGHKRLLAVKLVPAPCVPKAAFAFSTAELNCNGEEFTACSVRVDLDF
eukprot:scaffold5813_cov135-Skeletonema_dohrnii-CCMP3373.AAC.4